MLSDRDVLERARRDDDDPRDAPGYPDHPCGTCGGDDWCLAFDDIFGADADGRRGAPLRVWECRCGNETETVDA